MAIGGPKKVSEIDSLPFLRRALSPAFGSLIVTVFLPFATRTGVSGSTRRAMVPPLPRVAPLSVASQPFGHETGIETLPFLETFADLGPSDTGQEIFWSVTPTAGRSWT